MYSIDIREGSYSRLKLTVLWFGGMCSSQLSHQDSLQFSAIIIAQLCFFQFQCHILLLEKKVSLLKTYKAVNGNVQSLVLL